MTDVPCRTAAAPGADQARGRRPTSIVREPAFVGKVGRVETTHFLRPRYGLLIGERADEGRTFAET